MMLSSLFTRAHASSAATTAADPICFRAPVAVHRPSCGLDAGIGTCHPIDPEAARCS